MEEVQQITTKYAQRVDKTKIPAQSRWTAKKEHPKQRAM
jgi:hypothetical protein